MNILIIDDHAVVRHGLKQILREVFAAATFGEASDGAEGLHQIQASRWDLCILDITLPGRNGLDVLREIKRIATALPVLVHSMHPEEHFAVRALKAGASGYVSKTALPEKLLKAIRKVLAGGRYVSSDLAERLALELQGDSEKPLHEKLSDREYHVLQLIAGGKTTTEIADELCLSVQTISTYRSRILEKMQMKTNAELIRYAIQHGLEGTVKAV